MDRMTKWNGKKYILPQGKGEFRRIADRLAAYEDTGLEPEEIKRLLRGEENTAKSRRVFISGAVTGTDDYKIEVTMSLLKKCSGIYMLKDWENSRGAAKEFQYATTHNYFIIKEAY